MRPRADNHIGIGREAQGEDDGRRGRRGDTSHQGQQHPHTRGQSRHGGGARGDSLADAQ